MENIFDGLLEFRTHQDFEDYLKSINKEDALKLIELAILYAQKNGLYSLTESYTMYICLQKIKNENGEQ